MAAVVQANDGSFTLSGLDFVQLSVLAAVLDEQAVIWTGPPRGELERETGQAVLQMDSAVSQFVAERVCAGH